MLSKLKAKVSTLTTAGSPPKSTSSSEHKSERVVPVPEISTEEWAVKPEFIYGGPFIKPPTKPPFMNGNTPFGLQLTGTYKMSYAYRALTERLPIILTKVIDQCAKNAVQIKADSHAAQEEVQKYIQYVAKLKNDLITNKQYDLLTVDTPNAKKWNEWIEDQEQKSYFTNTWVFTECYVYRRLREASELNSHLDHFDPFESIKEKSFADNLEPMCIVADKLITMLPKSEKDQRKQDFITLLKLSLWSNKVDLSLTAGSSIHLDGEPGSKPLEGVIDPFQMNIDLKDKVIADDSNKIADTVVNKAEALAKKIAENTTFKQKCSCHRLATLAGMAKIEKPPESKHPEATTHEAKGHEAKGHEAKPHEAKGHEAKGHEAKGHEAKPSEAKGHEAKPSEAKPSEAKPNEAKPSEAKPSEAKPSEAKPAETSERPSSATIQEPPIPCQAKVLIPSCVMFDVICDNAGYELFTDMCLAHFLIEQEIVGKVRFHVKQIPWFVSDVVYRDFAKTIDMCAGAVYQREIPASETEPKTEARTINAKNLNKLGEQWIKFLMDGTWELMAEDYWTSPLLFKDMKRLEYNLYRKLQLGCALLFKGDLNYRKLLGEKKISPISTFESALQGFIPAPIIALRTVKSEVICGLAKAKGKNDAKYDALMKIDPFWMEKGEYGVIQFCPKAEALKVSTQPCLDYGTECFGEGCPKHSDM